MDYEVEVAIVIGKEGKYIPIEMLKNMFLVIVLLMIFLRDLGRKREVVNGLKVNQLRANWTLFSYKR